MSISSSEIPQAVRELPVRRLIKSLLVAAIIVIVVEITLKLNHRANSLFLLENRFYAPITPPTIEESIIQWQIFHAVNNVSPIDVLFLGDCSCALGYNPTIVESLIGLKAWNLGTMGVFCPIGHSTILEMYVKQKGAPKFLVYQATIAMLTRKPDHFWNGRLDRWISPVYKDNWSEDTLPSWQVRNSFQKMFLNLSTGYNDEFLKMNFTTTYPLNDNIINETLKTNRGYLPRIENDGPMLDEVRVDERFEVENISGLEQLFRIAQTHRIQVLVALTPMPESSKTRETERTVESVLLAIQKVASRFPNVEVMSQRYYQNGLFAELYHLNENGARRNTEEVTEWIRKRLGTDP